MKKILALLIFIIVAYAAPAQSDTARIEQYCQVIASPRVFSNKVTIDIDVGEERNFWTDNRLRTYAGKLKKFNTIIDALNFMGKEGWVFLNAYPINVANTTVIHYGFKKQFNRSEITE